jgi:hypothetical protein
LSIRVTIRTVDDVNAPQNHAFHHLLAAWTRREEARAHGDLAELSAARFALEDARAQMRIVTLTR